jgi:hypothetical protein
MPDERTGVFVVSVTVWDGVMTNSSVMSAMFAGQLVSSRFQPLQHGLWRNPITMRVRLASQFQRLCWDDAEAHVKAVGMQRIAPYSG